MNGRQPGLTGPSLWWLTTLALSLPALYGGQVSLDAVSTDWTPQAQAWVLHPSAGWKQAPWVWWTAAWVHGSVQHLGRNLFALLLLGIIAQASHATRRSALSWLMAWPMTHLGMLLQPALLGSYCGMSGVLHAGITILCIQHITTDHRFPTRRVFGLVLLLALSTKIIMENPWHNTVIHPSGSDITVAPWAHLSGIVAGLVSYLFGSVTSQLCRVTGLTSAARTLNPPPRENPGN